MSRYKPQDAAHEGSARRAPRPKAEIDPKPKFDPVAYAAALEILG